MTPPRMCSRFYCDHRGDRYCCADCHYLGCDNPCLNDPSRCGLEQKPETAPAKKSYVTVGKRRGKA